MMKKAIRWSFLLLVIAVIASACLHENETTPNVTADPETTASTYGKNTLNASSPLAVNVAPFNAWTPGWVLMDWFPKAQAWVSNICTSDDWASGPALSLDSKGWVSVLADGQCADTSIMAEQAGHYPVGTYVLLWEGDGSMRISWDVDPEVNHALGDVAETTNTGLKRLTFDVTAANQSSLGIGVRISQQAQDYIKNIRLIPPGGICGKSNTELDYFKYCATDRGGEGICATDESCFDFEEIYWDRFVDASDEMNSPKPVFHPLYAKSYQQYRSVRYMKWTRAEETLVENWSDRVTIDEQPYTTAERGLPIEHMIALSNLLNANMYLAVPMKATDDYHASMATFVNQGLNSPLKIFVEYGNEIFNSIMPLPYGYALEQGALLTGVNASDSDLVKAGSYAGYRSGQILMFGVRS